MCYAPQLAVALEYGLCLTQITLHPNREGRDKKRLWYDQVRLAGHVFNPPHPPCPRHSHRDTRRRSGAIGAWVSEIMLYVCMLLLVSTAPGAEELVPIPAYHGGT